jgi:hypothetical protein
LAFWHQYRLIDALPAQRAAEHWPLGGFVFVEPERTFKFRPGVHMQILARAVIQAITFLSLSDDTVIQPDVAVQVLEDITHTLRASSHDELAALQAIITEEQERLRTNSHPQRDKLVAHYHTLLDDLGLTPHDSLP